MALLKLSSDIIDTLYCDEEDGDLYVRDSDGNAVFWSKHKPKLWWNIRSLRSYIQHFSKSPTDIENFFDDIYAKKQNLGKRGKLSILDSGCGKGCAIHDMLDIPSIGKIYGITDEGQNTLDYLLDDERVEIYLGTIKEANGQFQDIDIIFDVFGPYFYCEDRIEVIRKYYNMMDVGGTALIVHSNDDEGVKDMVKRPGHTYSNLITYFLDEYPEVFSSPKTGCLKISKTDSEVHIRSLPFIEKPKQVSIKKNKMFRTDGSKYPTHPFAIYDATNSSIFSSIKNYLVRK